MSDAPEFRVVRGTPTPEELAALVGVLWARQQGPDPADVPAPTSRWRAGGLPSEGGLPRPGPGAWRAAR